MGVEPGLSGKSFIIQGYGNVGYWASKYFVQAGAKLVGVAEYNGSIYDPSGINPDLLWEHKKTKDIIKFPASKVFDGEDAIYQQAYTFLLFIEIFSSQQPYKNPSMHKTLTK